MKKHLFGRRLAAMATTALVGLGCAVPAAHAEITAYSGNDLIPSIQVYLRVDAGGQFITGVDNQMYGNKNGRTSIFQGGGNSWGTSMFGVHGALNLTQDTQAIYRLESGFNTDDGSFNGGKNQIFNRRAYAGFSDDRYGSLVVGKDLFINNDIWAWDPMVQETTSTATLVEGRNWPQVNDMVEYRSPTTYALKLGLQASFNPASNGTSPGIITSTHLSDAAGGSLQYTLGNLNLLGIYDIMRSNHGYTNLYTSSKEAIFGATYNFNPVELFAGYENLDAPQAGKDNSNAVAVNASSIIGGNNTNAATPVYATKANMTWLGAVWTVSPKITVRGAWYYTNVNDNAGHANLVTMGTEYYFRPNMFWYGTVGEVINAGKAQFGVTTDNAPPGAGKDQFTGYSGVSIAF